VVGIRLPTLSIRRPPAQDDTVIPADIAKRIRPIRRDESSLLERSSGMETSNEYIDRRDTGSLRS